MDITFLIPLIAFPITIFFASFVAARQMRSFENVPVFSKVYVEYRILFSVVTAGFITLFFGFLFFFRTGFAIPQLIFCIGLFLLLSLGYYYGVTLGWGRPSSETNSTTSVNQPQNNALPENVIVESQPSSIKIIITTKKRWVWFGMSLFQLIFAGLCALPILGIVVVSILGKYIPKELNILALVAVGGLGLYLLYTKFQEALEYMYDKEIIEIDNLVVRIEKYGSSFKNIREYPAENVKKITALFSFAGTNIAIKRSPFANQNMPAFMLWHERGLKRFRYFGRGLDMADAQSILESVYTKFPQYRG